jgi:hypothetical protein
VFFAIKSIAWHMPQDTLLEPAYFLLPYHAPCQSTLHENQIISQKSKHNSYMPELPGFKINFIVKPSLLLLRTLQKQ